MRMCSEKSIKHLFHIHGTPKAGRGREPRPCLTWTVSPHADLQEKLRTRPWPQHVPAAFTKTQLEHFCVVLQSWDLYSTPPDNLAQAGRPLPSFSGRQGLLTPPEAG